MSSSCQGMAGSSGDAELDVKQWFITEADLEIGFRALREDKINWRIAKDRHQRRGKHFHNPEANLRVTPLHRYRKFGQQQVSCNGRYGKRDHDARIFAPAARLGDAFV